MKKARIVITNYHAFKRRERLELSAGGRALLEGATGPELQTLETEGQMLQRVMPELMGMKHDPRAERRGAPLLPREAAGPGRRERSRATTARRPRRTTRPRGCGSPASKR